MSRRYPNPNSWPSAPQSKKRFRFTGCLFRTLGLLLVLAGVYIWLTYRPSGRAADLAPAVSAFTGEPEMVIKQTRAEKTPYGSVKQYSGNLENGDQAYFDVDKNGAVASFYRAGQPNGNVRISMDRARRTAMDFATTHYPDLPWLDTVQPSENLTGTEGSSNRFYTFRWTGQDPQSGAYLPQILKIEVNAQTGQVDSCSMLNEPVTISTIPSIDHQAATEQALSALPDSPAFEIADVSLTVTTIPIYEPKGEQALVWIITVTSKPDETGYVAGAVVFIDAHTGEVLLVDPFV